MTETTKPQATINGKVYYLDSDNTDLLETLEKVKYNKDTKNYDDVPYLSIATIYSLLEQFYPNYSFEAKPLEKEWSYVIKKKKFNYETKQKEEIEEEVILFKKSAVLSLWDRKIEWDARSVATISQISIDQTYNGFASKCEARALKNICKKLGKVFRIDNDREENMEKNSIKSDLSITDVVKGIQWVAKTNATEQPTAEIENKMSDILEADYRALVKERQEANKDTPIAITDIQGMGIKLREKHNFKKWEPADEAMKKVYTKLKTEFNL